MSAPRSDTSPKSPRSRPLSCAAALLSTAVALPCLTLSGEAMATNGLESPSAGIEQMSRGGAWLARADNGLAAYFNPAALATQPHNVHLGAQMLFRKHCFERRDTTGAPVSPGNDLLAPPGEVCGDYNLLPNPQLGGTIRLHRHVALGIALVAPHSNVGSSWPATIDYADASGTVRPHPAPQRYLLLDSEAIAMFPTLSIGVNITKQLQVGAGFTWGFAKLEFSNTAEAISPPPIMGELPADDYRRDIRSRISGFDGFIPGGVFSVQYSPLRQLDIAAFYRVSDAIRTNVDLLANFGYYTSEGAVNEASVNDPAFITDVPEAGTFKLAIPMEAKLGFRYRHPRKGARGQKWLSRWRGWARDSITEDVFDIELDLTWAHNAMIDNIEIQLRPDIEIQGFPAPTNANQARMWNHVFGVRLGGEWVPIPDLVAIRAGGFFESKGVNDSHLTLDFHQGLKGGIALGGKVRLGRVDIALGYQHTFYGALDNGGQGQIKALSGGGTEDFRSFQTVNGGRSTMSLNEVGLSGTVRF